MTDEQRAREAARWLVYSREHNAFWRANRAGYTNLIEHAGRYTKAEADACCRSRDHAHPDNPPEVAVLAPEAAQALTAKDAEIEDLKADLSRHIEIAAQEATRTEAAEARIAELEGALAGIFLICESCFKEIPRSGPLGQISKRARGALTKKENPQ